MIKFAYLYKLDKKTKEYLKSINLKKQIFYDSLLEDFSGAVVNGIEGLNENDITAVRLVRFKRTEIAYINNLNKEKETNEIKGLTLILETQGKYLRGHYQLEDTRKEIESEISKATSSNINLKNTSYIGFFHTPEINNSS
jgi:hypothetical protein